MSSSSSASSNWRILSLQQASNAAALACEQVNIWMKCLTDGWHGGSESGGTSTQTSELHLFILLVHSSSSTTAVLFPSLSSHPSWCLISLYSLLPLTELNTTTEVTVTLSSIVTHTCIHLHCYHQNLDWSLFRQFCQMWRWGEKTSTMLICGAAAWSFRWFMDGSVQQHWRTTWN